MIEAAADLQPISAPVSTVAVLQRTTVVVHLSVRNSGWVPIASQDLQLAVSHSGTHRMAGLGDIAL